MTRMELQRNILVADSGQVTYSKPSKAVRSELGDVWDEEVTILMPSWPGHQGLFVDAVSVKSRLHFRCGVSF